MEILNCDLIAGEHAVTVPLLLSKKGPTGISKPISPTKHETPKTVARMKNRVAVTACKALTIK